MLSFNLIFGHRYVYNRTVFNAVPTARAEIHIDTTRPFFNLYFKVSGGSLHRLQIRVCDDFNIQVPADLDQFGRDNSHGTIIGGESFVQLSHNSANGRGFFDEIDIISRVGKIQSRLHPGNPST
jgi:hypothetical protein